MNDKEALEKLKAYLKCQKRQVKGIYEDCYSSGILKERAH